MREQEIGKARHRGRAARAPRADQSALPLQRADHDRLPHSDGAAAGAQTPAPADVAPARACFGRRASSPRSARETRLVEAYLDIERARFEQRLRVRIDVPARPSAACASRPSSCSRSSRTPSSTACRRCATAARSDRWRRLDRRAAGPTRCWCSPSRDTGAGRSRRARARSRSAASACATSSAGSRASTARPAALRIQSSRRRRARSSNCVFPPGWTCTAIARRSQAVVVTPDCAWSSPMMSARRARSSSALLRSFDDVVVVGEAASGQGSRGR